MRQANRALQYALGSTASNPEIKGYRSLFRELLSSCTRKVRKRKGNSEMTPEKVLSAMRLPKMESNG